MNISEDDVRLIIAGLVLNLAACGAVKATCATSSCDDNATCTDTANSFTCACNAGYTGDGLTCSPVACATLAQPANGTVATTNNDVGGVATYSCTGLFRVDGPSMRTCQADGTWSGAEPICKACTMGQRMIFASQTDSTQYDPNNTGVFNYRDNSTRAYANPANPCGGGGQPGCDITAWMGFDVTSVPDTAAIQAMTVNAYANTVQMNPTVRLQYSAINNWTRANSPPADFVRTLPEISAQVALTATNVGTVVSIPVNVSVTNWSVDLTDNWITIGIDNALTVYSYAYFDGADILNPDHRPFLQITYCD